MATDGSSDFSIIPVSRNVYMRGGYSPWMQEKVLRRMQEGADAPRQPFLLTEDAWMRLCSKAIGRVVHREQRAALEWLLDQEGMSIPLEAFDPLPEDADLEALCNLDGVNALTTWKSVRFEAIARWLTGRGLVEDIGDECGDVLWAEAVEHAGGADDPVGFGEVPDALWDVDVHSDAELCGIDGQFVVDVDLQLCSFVWDGAGIGLSFSEFQGIKYEPFTGRSASVTMFLHDSCSGGVIWKVVDGNILDDADAIRDLGLDWIGPAMDEAPDDGPATNLHFGYGDFYNEEEIEAIASGFAFLCGVPQDATELEFYAGTLEIPEVEELQVPKDDLDWDYEEWDVRLQGYVDRAFKIWLWGGDGLRPSERASHQDRQGDPQAGS